MGPRGALRRALGGVPAPSRACGSLRVRGRVGAGARGTWGRGWWPWLGDTLALTRAITGVFLPRRTCCPTSPEEETEEIAGPVVAAPDFWDAQSTPNASGSSWPVFPVPVAQRCPGCAPPPQPALLPLPPARTQTLLSRKVAKDEL